MNQSYDSVFTTKCILSCKCIHVRLSCCFSVVAKCFPVLLFGGGLMNCTEGHDSNRSTCRVQCPPGHLLLGFVEFTCRADGTWESSFPLMCASEEVFSLLLFAADREYNESIM